MLSLIFKQRLCTCDTRFLTIITSLAWFVLPIIYTIYTIHEIDPIPFGCPSNYDYKSEITKTACKIRAANFIFMWLYLAYAIFSLIIMCNLMFDSQVEKPITEIEIIENGDERDEDQNDKLSS
ncbi:7639_t:CDS:2 [Scutellospora calospora]|uniref:7639_t:CDS:1 n=1 Tax=Scutellospora calospora TaxID=85575 RepID=A0ACA9K7F2_9GLOM|nr:7639_t:CDS:2 [Scutellospora calospora]